MKRNKFNLGNTQLVSCDMGQLVPISCVEALPGDTIQGSANVVIRVSPMAAPVFHNVTARVHHFFVANRTLWDGAKTGDSGSWEDFITGGPDGMNADTPPTIAIPSGAPGAKQLLDFLGVPTQGDAVGVNVNALPVRAFNAIYNEYYRDQDLISKRDHEDITIPQVAWEKDYFSSSRPWTQKGPDVTIPLGDKVPIQGIGTTSASYPLTNQTVYDSALGQTTYPNAQTEDALLIRGALPTGIPEIYADLEQALGGNVNDVRKAFAIQRYQEARARYGSRYTEYLRYLGVTPQDSRIQRPEYLGGGRVQLNFSEIMQTAPESTTDPNTSTNYGVGDLYGHGIAAMRSNKYRRFMPEHGYVISLLSVRPKTVYQDGIHRSWLRKTKEDYFQKELQHIGQQEVYNNEIYASATNGEEVFGYQDRYREYRENPSLVTGEFRDILNYWHMARKFDSTPVLNQSFVDCVPTKRIYNEQGFDSLWVMVQNKIMARRIVSRVAAPRIL